MTYIWEKPDWPRMRWRSEAIAAPLADLLRAQGRLLGRMQDIGFSLRQEASVRILTQDVVKTSEIEGEILDAHQVRSSLVRRLGMEAGALPPTDRQVEGVVEMTLDATGNCNAPLTRQRLFGWHAALFPTGYSGLHKIRTGDWRDDSTGPMQIVSGPVGRERVHYTAPPAERIAADMQAFLAWFNADQQTDPVLQAAQAHLWFVTIHPFADGNGRIARAIADLALTRAEKSPHRFYSMSTRIRAERRDYYDILAATQRGGPDITPWMQWFLTCLHRAIEGADATLSAVLAKARFWNTHSASGWNPRQIKVVNRLLDGFEGRLTSSKWARMTKTSQDTANRDIAALVRQGILRKSTTGGRSTHYELIL